MSSSILCVNCLILILVKFSFQLHWHMGLLSPCLLSAHNLAEQPHFGFSEELQLQSLQSFIPL
jgi:hypothetical protein